MIYHQNHDIIESAAQINLKYSLLALKVLKELLMMMNTSIIDLAQTNWRNMLTPTIIKEDHISLLRDLQGNGKPVWDRKQNKATVPGNVK